jgi:hypothetical protein
MVIAPDSSASFDVDQHLPSSIDKFEPLLFPDQRRDPLAISFLPNFPFSLPSLSLSSLRVATLASHILLDALKSTGSNQSRFKERKKTYCSGSFQR